MIIGTVTDPKGNNNKFKIEHGILQKIIQLKAQQLNVLGSNNTLICVIWL